MGLAYYFHMESVPRTVTRTEWYKTWRQVRIDSKEHAKMAEKELKMFRSAPDHIREQMLDHMINPPLVLGPYMDRHSW